MLTFICVLFFILLNTINYTAPYTFLNIWKKKIFHLSIDCDRLYTMALRLFHIASWNVCSADNCLWWHKQKHACLNWQLFAFRHTLWCYVLATNASTTYSKRKFSVAPQRKHHANSRSVFFLVFVNAQSMRIHINHNTPKYVFTGALVDELFGDWGTTGW